MRTTVLLLCLSAATAASAADSQRPRVGSEPSRTQSPKAMAGWRAAGAPVARLGYGEMSAQRIHALQQANAARTGKPVQIGIARDTATETRAGRLPPLQWSRLADGSSAARIEFVSPLAYGVRAGLRMTGLDPRAELRFAGSARPDRIVAAVSAAQAAMQTGEDGVYWTPATDGERQIVEVWLPAGAQSRGVGIEAPRLSHLMTNAIEDFKILKNIGGSEACNVDTVCRVGELGQSFVSAKAAVARMTFVDGYGSSYYCTGTLLNDTDANTQVPYFHTAHHCIPTQSMAITLNTYWNFEATTCNVDSSPQYVLLSAGADYLYSDAQTDGSLLRLRDEAPAGATFAGWDANPLPESSNVTAIHHPAGDLKKVSTGRHRPEYSDAVNHAVGWLQGSTEGGSSGSGLFTIGSGGYYLRGGLYRGSASCANTGSLQNSSNADFYSRFDVDFPNIRDYLAPAPAAPRRRNGSQPLRAP